MTLKDKIRSRVATIKTIQRKPPTGIVISDDILIEIHSNSELSKLYIYTYDQFLPCMPDKFMGLNVSISEGMDILVIY